MEFPADAVAATALIEVVRLTERPQRFGDPVTGSRLASWTAKDASEALALLSSMEPGGRRACPAPGFGLRVYDAVEELLFEMVFCFSCDRTWLWGPAVPPDLTLGAEPDALLSHFHDAA
ncbi:hypothetical protein ABZ128_18500 [Streptomyces sp. NPDC006326]|uniref:hypothetical protein n=1 Tax=Streptomyces sp. NPDC006326 TaxID=3156752 RepID=UPI0033B1B203